MLTINTKTYNMPEILKPGYNKEFNVYSFDWNRISMYSKLPISFIRDYKDNLNWYAICRYNTVLTENDLIEFKDYIRWDIISKYQKLSENFSQKFSDRLDITSIVSYQNVSDKFIIEFKDKIDWEAVPINRILSSNTLMDIISTIPSIRQEISTLVPQTG